MVNSQTSYHRLVIHKILVLLLLISLSWLVGHGKFSNIVSSVGYTQDLSSSFVDLSVLVGRAW